MCIVSLINELAFPRPDPQWGAEHLQAHPGLVQLVTSENEGIPAVHIKHPGAFFTVLYSHGNAEDVSISLDYLHDMAAALQCNIFAYEYVGYSLRCATHGDAARGSLTLQRRGPRLRRTRRLCTDSCLHPAQRAAGQYSQPARMLPCHRSGLEIPRGHQGHPCIANRDLGALYRLGAYTAPGVPARSAAAAGHADLLRRLCWAHALVRSARSVCVRRRGCAKRD